VSQGDAMHKRSICYRKASFCPPVCLSLTVRYCVETAVANSLDLKVAKE